jgi:2-oxoisovalerate dehydrogenase E1 component
VSEDDLDPLETALLAGLRAIRPGTRPTTARPLEPATAAAIVEAQIVSRLLDHTARWLRTLGRGYYTIGSAGHEANAVVAAALRPTDPALLHYRSGGFYAARAGQVPGHDPVSDVLRGVLALATEPISGGRHKVFGHHELHVIPQTSTIASHLPRAVGLALALRWGDPASHRWPADSLVVCTFGDASLNHSTAQGALNWASLEAHRGRAVPILFVCEDNGLGISVPTPEGWVARSTRARPGLAWASVDGQDPSSVFEATSALAEEARQQGRPGLLHLRTVRYLGHAGTDVESAYRAPAELRADLVRDPILGTAQVLVDAGTCRPDDLVEWYLDQRAVIRSRALELADTEAELTSADQIQAPLAPPRPAIVAARAEGIAATPLVPPPGAARTLAQSLNDGLASVLAANPRALVFGEDVARKGGVYGVTRGLQKRFGPDRVFDTHLDEQSILGFALGAALDGFLPIPEIQYLAYLHNAEDQLRGEAASLAFFSNGRYRNPMVVRIAGYAYQRGFGGHFHNDNAVAVLRDIPGLIIASPAHPADAGAMLHTCVAAAETEGAVCVLLEPIARYHTADLHDDGDGAWLAGPSPGPVGLGRARTHGEGRDCTILTSGNGLYLSLRAARHLAARYGIDARVVDLRWLSPLPVDDMVREAEATGRVLVVDETRRTGGAGEGIVTALVEAGFRGPITRVAARDSFVPLGTAARLVLVGEDDIVDAAHALSQRG